MRNSRGFIALPAMAWGAIAAGVVILALGVGLKVQTARLDSVKAEYAGFRAQVEALGREAEKARKAKELSDRKAKEQADAKTKRLLADNADLGKRLRDANASRSIVSTLPTSTSNPNRICFDRTKFAGAMAVIENGIPAIAESGDIARLKLSSSVEWAKSLEK